MDTRINFLFYCFVIFLFTSWSNAEQIVYINIEKIMKESKAGKQIIQSITKSNELNINKFKKIEEDLRAQEKDLLAKKNVISEDEFQKKFDKLKKEISEYRSKRQNIINDTTKKRIEASADFSNRIKPILGDYAAKNNIAIIVQKKKYNNGKKGT